MTDEKAQILLINPNTSQSSTQLMARQARALVMPSRYPEPITAQGYLEERLREIKLK